MKQCIDCGLELTIYNTTPQSRCPQCHKDTATKPAITSNDQPKRPEAIPTPAPVARQERFTIDSVMLTTETAPNLDITKRIEIVTAECAFGMNIFKDLFAGVRNVVGGRSKAVQKTMRESRRTALYELKREAYEVGANAVVGVDLDYVELAGTGSSMVMLVASGTAVRIKETDHV